MIADKARDLLAAPLDPARIHHREGGGGRSLSYLEGHDVIRAANDIFGIGGWSYGVQSLECVGSEQVETSRNGQTRLGWRVAYRATVRVEIGADGPSYSDVGFGDAVEYAGSALTPHELASKEAVTDALKRALKNLGDQFGLCLYDKSYVPGKSSAAVPPGRQNDNRAEGGSGSAGVGGRDTAAGATASPAAFTWASGKHQGKSLSETPTDYIEWYSTNGPKEEVRGICQAWLGGNLGDESAVQEELAKVGAELINDIDLDDLPF